MLKVQKIATAAAESDLGLRPVASYFATAGGEIVDEAADMLTLIGRINDTFKLKTESVVLWKVWAGQGPELMAYVVPGGKAGNKVVYVEGRS
jgi:hypothetical protein